MRAHPFAFCILVLPLCVRAGPLNDTGIDFCRDLVTGVDTPVTASSTCTEAQGGQDARYGRDAAASRGVLPKVGGGGGGFDFTKIANNGTSLPAGAALGAGSTDWACTYDNNTGLMWEVKTAGGLRAQGHTYTWYDSVHDYGGNAGTASGGTCETVGRCDTEKFVADVNALNPGLCGHNDWRMPTVQELTNLLDNGQSILFIDVTYFQNTSSTAYWSASPYAGDVSRAWSVGFGTGYVVWGSPRSYAHAVRLVRTAN